MPSNRLILCHPLLLLSVFPSIRVFSNESALHIGWPKYGSFSVSISPSNEYSGLISFRNDWFDLFAVQGTLKSLPQHHNSKASVLCFSAFFMTQLSYMYMTTGKMIVLTIWTFLGEVMVWKEKSKVRKGNKVFTWCSLFGYLTCWNPAMMLRESQEKIWKATSRYSDFRPSWVTRLQPASTTRHMNDWAFSCFHPTPPHPQTWNISEWNRDKMPTLSLTSWKLLSKWDVIVSSSHWFGGDLLHSNI